MGVGWSAPTREQVLTATYVCTNPHWHGHQLRPGYGPGHAAFVTAAGRRHAATGQPNVARRSSSTISERLVRRRVCSRQA